MHYEYWSFTTLVATSQVGIPMRAYISGVISSEAGDFPLEQVPAALSKISEAQGVKLLNSDNFILINQVGITKEAYEDHNNRTKGKGTFLSVEL